MTRCCSLGLVIQVFLVVSAVLFSPMLFAQEKCEIHFSPQRHIEKLTRFSVKPEAVESLTAAENRATLRLISNTAEKIQSESFVDLVAYSFRRHIFNEDLTISDVVDVSSIPPLIAAKITRYDESVIANATAAIINHFEGQLEPLQAAYISLSLGKILTKKSFAKVNHNELKMNSEIEVPMALNFLTQSALAKPVIRKQFEALFNSTRFKTIGVGIMRKIHSAEGSPSFSQGSNRFIDLFFATNGKPVKLSANDTKSVSRVSFTLLLMLTGAKDPNGYDHASAFRMERDKNSKPTIYIKREGAINEIESFFLDMKEAGTDQKSSDIIDFIDYHLFSTRFPLDHQKTAGQLRKSLQSDLKTLQSESSQGSIADFSNSSLFRSTGQGTGVQRIERVQARSQKVKTRAKGNQTGGESGPSTQRAEETFTLLSEIAEFQANTDYPFYMIRQNSGEVHHIKINQDVLDEMARQNEPLEPFLKAINYGFTSRDGSIGIKRFGSRFGIKNLYYVRPGRSSFRMLMTRGSEDHWEVTEFLYKDDVIRASHQYSGN